MASRRDQLHSYQFMVQRVVSALVFRKTDPDQSPFRRAGGAVFASIMVAVLALAVVGVIGFITGGPADPEAAKQYIIVEKETGARYVLIDGVLHPVLNTASGALIVGKAETLSRSGNSLAQYPRGATVGIPNAPDAIPPADRLLKDGWALCSRPGDGGPTSVLYAGSQPAEGNPLAAGQALAAVFHKGQADEKWWLITEGHRYGVARDLVDAVGGSTSDPSLSFPAEAAWINSVPEGAPVTVPPVENVGQPSQAISGAKIGAMFADPTGKRYVVLADGWSEITPLQAALLQAKNPSATVGQVASGPAIGARSATSLFPTGTEGAPVLAQPPSVVPVGAGGTACAIYTDHKGVPGVLTDATIPARSGIKTTETNANGGDLVNEVVIEPGHAVLVESMTGAEGSGTVLFVNEMGVAYAFADRSLITTFGYTEKDIVKLPATVTGRLPMGPALDPVEAKKNAIMKPK